MFMLNFSMRYFNKVSISNLVIKNNLLSQRMDYFKNTQTLPQLSQSLLCFRLRSPSEGGTMPASAFKRFSQ